LGKVASVIATRAVRELGLEIGSEVIAFVKVTDVAIVKLRDDCNRARKSLHRFLNFSARGSDYQSARTKMIRTFGKERFHEEKNVDSSYRRPRAQLLARRRHSLR
jgi:hypothetical protein